MELNDNERYKLGWIWKEFEERVRREGVLGFEVSPRIRELYEESYVVENDPFDPGRRFEPLERVLSTSIILVAYTFKLGRQEGKRTPGSTRRKPYIRSLEKRITYGKKVAVALMELGQPIEKDKPKNLKLVEAHLNKKYPFEHWEARTLGKEYSRLMADPVVESSVYAFAGVYQRQFLSVSSTPNNKNKRR